MRVVVVGVFLTAGMASAQSPPGSTVGGERDDAPLTPPVEYEDTPKLDVFGFGMAIDVALGFGADTAQVDARLSLLAQYGRLSPRGRSKARGSYFGVGVEGTAGSLCASASDDYCGDGWRARGTIGPTARMSWGTGKAADSVFPLFSVYAKATPFVSFNRGDAGAGGRLGLGLNGPGASRDLVSGDDEDSGSAQADALGTLIGVFVAGFTHVELFVEVERLAGATDVRGGFAIGFGL
jgi:hypothetical protein